MEDSANKQLGFIIQRHCQFLRRLKEVVEALFAKRPDNVLSTFGGLKKLTDSLEAILRDGLKDSSEDSTTDRLWTFIRALNWLNPELARGLETVSREPRSEPSKTRNWIRHSLEKSSLNEQVSCLTHNKQHLSEFYTEQAFMQSEQFVRGMCACISAVELNDVSLLTKLDPALLSHTMINVPIRSRSTPSNKCSALSTSLPGGYTTSFNALHRELTTSATLIQDSITFIPTSMHQDQTQSTTPGEEETRTEVISSLCTGERGITNQAAEHGKPDDSDHTDKKTEKTTSDTPNFFVPLEPASDDDSVYEEASGELLTVDNLQTDKTSSNQPVESGQNDSNTTTSGFETMTTTAVTSPFGSVSSGSGLLDSVIQQASGEALPEPDSPRPVEGPQTTGARASLADIRPSRRYVKNQVPNSSKAKSHTRSRSDFDVEAMKSANEGAESPDYINRAALEASRVPAVLDGVPRSSSSVSSSLTATPSNRRSSPGIFPRPTQGQTLRAFLNERDFQTCAELDKENAHFSICEALIEAIETMKYNGIIQTTVRTIEEDESDEEIRDLKQRIRIRRRQKVQEKLGSRAPGYNVEDDGRSTGESSHSESQHSHSDNSDVDDTSIVDNRLQSQSSRLSLASLYSDSELQAQDQGHELQPDLMNSAEMIAISLLKRYSDQQLPKASELHWLVSDMDTPQQLLPLPTSYCADAEESVGSTRIRGNQEWAPPRDQIILNVPKAAKRQHVLARQNYRCAGCGIKIQAGILKRLRYCEYLGKFFCHCCHNKKSAVIPARVLKHWDFGKYHVSNFAYDLLSRVVDLPLLSDSEISNNIFRRQKLLEESRQHRLELHHQMKYINSCRLAAQSNLTDALENIPDHWYTDLHMWSMNDLFKVKSGHMTSILRHVVSLFSKHIKSCPLCSVRGFFCELCQSDDLLFPFELSSVQLCPDCHACFHRQCFVPYKCPRCARKEVKKCRHDSLDDELAD